jgi:hypothetical protein
MRNLTQVEGMSIDALRAGIDWRFETFAEYLAQLRERGSVANVAAYVGHSSVRTYVMGDDAAKRAATAAEIAQMQAIVRAAMAHGAVGFASSTSPAHNGEGGLPMPSRLASDEEMAALVGAMAEDGRGVYMLTKGGHEDLVPRVARRGDRPAGDGRGAASQQRRAARGVRRPRRDRRRQRARPPPARPGLVLRADDGLSPSPRRIRSKAWRAGSRRSARRARR